MVESFGFLKKVEVSFCFWFLGAVLASRLLVFRVRPCLFKMEEMMRMMGGWRQVGAIMLMIMLLMS